jgi:hypothetical protein
MRTWWGWCGRFPIARCGCCGQDPRTVVFTVLPGHGLLMAEKWVPGARPFEVLLAAMDERRLEVGHGVPQGSMHYALVGDRMVLQLSEGVVRLGDEERVAVVRDSGFRDIGFGAHEAMGAEGL